MTTAAAQNKQRLKMAMIPVLGMVLLVALWRNFSVGSGEAGAELMVPQASAKQARPVAIPNSPSMIWPTIRLAELIATNPFEPLAENRPIVEPEIVEQPVETPTVEPVESKTLPVESEPPARQPAKVIERSIQKIDFIYESGGERVAVVNSRRIRVGDQLEGGRVVRITQQEVIVEHDANDGAGRSD